MLPVSLFRSCLRAASLLSLCIVTGGAFLPAAGSPVWAAAAQAVAEPVVFIRSGEGSAAEASLLYPPRKLLRIYSQQSGAEYPISHFAFSGRSIAYRGSEPLPSLNESELILDEKTPRSFGHYLDGSRYILYLPNAGLTAYQICVDYETDAVWEGPVPAFGPELLPRFQRKLAQGEPLRIAFLGDSISAGGDASGHMNRPPHKPPYTAQFADRLRAVTGSEVAVHNLSKGGQSSPWAVEQAQAAGALEPDLLVIAFGMNDASWSGVPVEDYGRNIATAMETVRKLSPQTEFVLISPMTPNPLWNRERPPLRAAYHEQLRQMEGTGVLVCDVRSPWLHLVDRKGFLSLSGNGLNHPNDYGHRLYADVLAESVLGPAAQQAQP